MRANGFFSVTPTLIALNASRRCLRAEFHRCRNFDTEVRFDPAFDRLEARSISRKTFKSIQLARIMRGESGGGPIACKQARPSEHGSLRRQEPEPRKEQMVDIILLLMVIASAVSLLVVSPRDLQKKAILALREYEDMELSCAHGRGEGGEARAIPNES